MMFDTCFELVHISSWVTTSYKLLCTFLELLKGKHCRTMSYLTSVLPLFPSDSKFKRFKRPFLMDSLSASHQLYGWNLQYHHLLYINQLGQKYDSLIYPPNPLVDYQSSVFLFLKYNTIFHPRPNHNGCLEQKSLTSPRNPL